MPKLSEVTAEKPRRLSEVTASANDSDLARLVTGKPKKTVRTLGFGSREEGNAYGMGGAYAIADALDAGQHHIGNALLGTGQLIHKGVTAAADLLPEGNAVRQWANDVDQRGQPALAKREADYQARVPNSPAAYAGAAAGEVLPWMTGIAELRAAGLLPQITAGGVKGALQKGGLLALEGGVMGASQPVTGEGSYAGQKAAQVGIGAVAAPVLGAGTAGLSGLARLSRYATPGGRDAIANERLAKLYGADAEVLAKLRAQSGVPGVELTPAQVLATPRAVQAERVLRNNGDTAPAFAERESANNVATRGQVDALAGDDAAMEAARRVRRTNKDAYRAQNLPEQGSPLVDATGIFDTLQRLTLSANPTVRGAAREHLSLLKKQAIDGKVPAYVLDDVRQEAGGMIAKHTPASGSASKEAAKYAPVTNQIADALDRAVPGYRNYLAAYARDSQPINDMEAGRKLLAAIDSGGRDAGGNQAVSLNQVKALLAADNRANFPMSDAARKQIEAVLEVLQKRSVTNNTIAASGPGSAADLQRAVQASPLLMRLLGYSASGIGGMTGGFGGMAAGMAATELATAANSAVTRRLGEKAASAPRTADALEAYLSKQKPGKPSLLDLLLPYEQRALPPPR